MKSDRKTLFIVNPVSANGRTDRQWRVVEKALRETGCHFAVRRTTRPLDAIDLTRSALLDGFDHIVAVGGDGTINEVVNGFYYQNSDEKINKEARFSAIPMGTGSDFSRILNLSSDFQAIHEICQGGQEFACDIVSASYTGWNGEQEHRHFINIADVGIGSETVFKVNNSSKAMGGFLSFLIGALSVLIRFKNKGVHVKVDDTEVFAGDSSLVAIGNGQYFGGGVRVAPSAQIGDGLLDVVILKDFSKLELIRLIPKAYKGKHLEHPKVNLYKGRTVEIQSAAPLYLEIDGETPGHGNCRFEIQPADLKIIR